jgi:hypothetical protein
MRLRKQINSDFRPGVAYPSGTEVTLIEPLDEWRDTWLVEVRVPDESLVGGASYDTVEVQFVDLEADVSTATLDAEARSAELDPSQDVAAAAAARTGDVDLNERAEILPRRSLDAHPHA